MKIKKLFFVIFVIALLIPSTSIFAANVSTFVLENEGSTDKYDWIKTEHYNYPNADTPSTIGSYNNHKRATTFLNSYTNDEWTTLTNKLGKKNGNTYNNGKPKLATSIRINHEDLNSNLYLVIITEFEEASNTYPKPLIKYITAYLKDSPALEGYADTYYSVSGNAINATQAQLAILQAVY